jgi:hypothetical protein
MQYEYVQLICVILKKIFLKNKPMDENIFWDIISTFDWDKIGDDDAVLKPALDRLVTMTTEDILLFAEILAEKLYNLDGIAYASNIGVDSYYQDKEHFSADYFLYIRCCVVANGKTFYNQVLNNPTEMPKELDFEALLYLPETAYYENTKKDYDHVTIYCFETFSNANGWKSNKV